MKLKALLAIAMMVLMFTGCATAGEKQEAPKADQPERLQEIQRQLPGAERKVKATDAWLRFATDKALLERVQGLFKESSAALLADPEYKEYQKLINEKTAIEKSMKTKTGEPK